MRILVAGPLENPVSNVHFICKTFEKLGQEVTKFDYRASAKRDGISAMSCQLLSLVNTTKPDVLFLVKGESIPHSLAREIAKKTHIALHYMDSPIHSWLKRLGPECHSFWVTAGGLVDKYRALGFHNVNHMWEGVDPAVHRHIEEDVPEYRCEVAFAGTNKAGREQLLNAVMKAGFHLKVWGRRWSKSLPVMGEFIGEDDFARLCYNADIILGMNDNNTIPDYFSQRTALTLASRGFHLTSYVPGLEKWFENGKHLAWFNVKRCIVPWRWDFSHCISLIRYYLDNPEERRKIAVAGQEYVYKFFTWERQLSQVLEKLKNMVGRD